MASKERRRLRELAGIAYERALSRELDGVLASFEAWKKGEISPFAVSDRIHEFHEGPARDLFVFYARGNAETAVARGLADGLLTEEEVGQDLISKLSRAIEYFQWEREDQSEVDESP